MSSRKCLRGVDGTGDSERGHPEKARRSLQISERLPVDVDHFFLLVVPIMRARGNARARGRRLRSARMSPLITARYLPLGPGTGWAALETNRRGGPRVLGARPLRPPGPAARSLQPSCKWASSSPPPSGECVSPFREEKYPPRGPCDDTIRGDRVRSNFPADLGRGKSHRSGGSSAKSSCLADKIRASSIRWEALATLRLDRECITSRLTQSLNSRLPRRLRMFSIRAGPGGFLPVRLSRRDRFLFGHGHRRGTPPAAPLHRHTPSRHRSTTLSLRHRRRDGTPQLFGSRWGRQYSSSSRSASSSSSGWRVGSSRLCVDLFDQPEGEHAAGAAAPGGKRRG